MKPLIRSWPRFLPNAERLKSDKGECLKHFFASKDVIQRGTSLFAVRAGCLQHTRFLVNFIA